MDPAAADLGRGRSERALRCLRGEVGNRPVAGDELGHDLLDPSAALESRLDLDGDLAAVDDDEAVAPMALPSSDCISELPVQFALADPRRIGVPVEDVQAHVGDGGDVREHPGIGTPHGVVDARERMPAPREPDEHRAHRRAARDREPSPHAPTGSEASGRVRRAVHHPGELRQRYRVLLADDAQQLEIARRAPHGARVGAPRASGTRDRCLGPVS